MNNHMHQSTGEQLLSLLPFLMLIVTYVFAAVLSNHKHKRWPISRYFYWILGVLSAAVALVGPVANQAHSDFTVHMTGHLMLGMLAPLLIAVAAPITLVLRTLSVKWSRRLSYMLKSRFFQVVSDPVIATLLNIGGLWFLYTTDLYMMMQQNVILTGLIHLHVFLAGYLFTVSVIYIDPTPHRRSFMYRGIVFILALAGHGILSKYLYAHPPAGVPLAQAETGSMLMYYGGDAIDIVLITIFCFQWYKAARPRSSSAYQSLDH